MSTEDEERAAALARGDVHDDKKDDDPNKGDKKPDNEGGEGEETAEEKAEREAEEKAQKEKEEREARIRIPKKRFDEAQRKARDREAVLNARIQELEKAVGGKKDDDELSNLQKGVKELRDKYEDLLLEGKKDEARKARADLEAAQDKLSDYKAAATSNAARREAVDTLRYEEALAKLEQSYPVLNPDNDETFDEEKVAEVSELMKAIMKSQGLQRHVALAKAARYVLGPPASKSDGLRDPEEVRKQREADARKKAADANKRQPADTGKAGKDSDKDGGGADGKIDIMKLSKSAFDKLSEDKLAALRGDEVAA